jgi:APA family basic amino acid/polyamine antiporter
LTKAPTNGDRSVSLFTATCIVVANMIGTGVFTSLGFQVGDLPSGFVIVSLWLIGGVCALCGALCYAELAAALPRSGGEYHLIGQTLHPAGGFLAGWLSVTVGFAAPIALAAMALGRYASQIWWPQGGVFIHWNLPADLMPPISGEAAIALLAVSLTTAVHLCGVRIGSLFQIAATLLKLILIAFVMVAGFCMGNPQQVHFAPSPGDARLFLHPSFAISLVFVMYAYSGWNAATYIVGEIRNPGRNVPRALLIGTGLVALLYVGLNAVFLRAAPIDELRGQVEVGFIAGTHIFGPTGGRVVGGFICLGLIASVSAMTWVGPRVAATMGEDLAVLRWLAPSTANGVPRLALLVQLGIVTALIVTSTFEKVLVYIQLALTLSSACAVFGLIVLRRRRPDLQRPFRVPFYPLTPLVFLAISVWMMIHIIRDKPSESLAGLYTLLAGLVLYFLSPKAQPDLPQQHDS